MTQPEASKQVVVGIDGSEADEHVLAWAADEAARRGVSLLIAHAREAALDSPASAALVVSTVAEQPDFSVDLLARSAATVARSHPAVTVHTLSREQKPAQFLLDLSYDADLIVLGTHGDNRFVGALVGSVSHKLAAHAHCPVVVLPAEPAASRHPDGPVVVGISRSPGGSAALHQAFVEAQLRSAELLAIRSWGEPAIYGIGSAGIGYIMPPPFDLLRQTAQSELDDCLAAVQPSFPDVKVRAELTSKSVDRTLVDASQGAALLVVGCRHEDGHRLSRLGPVGSWLLHNSEAPIVVVGFSSSATSAAS